jgi:hypothetical protein
MRGSEVHAAKLVDLPLVRRLAEKGTMLDSELSYTREGGGAQGVLLSSILLPQRGLYTLVGRADKQHVIGQLRLKPDDHLAQIVYMAPSLEAGMCDTAWLALMDAMAYEAGRRGAHILTAEVDEGSPLFVSMRQTGFAVYARQEIWRRNVADEPLLETHLSGVLVEETDDDQMDIQLLYSNIVPRLVQPITVPSRDSKGLVYRKADRVQGYIAVSEGKAGVYIMPYLHPEVLGREAAAIIAGVIAQSSRADRLPVYVCVRRYQDWLTESLKSMGFEAWTQQAVMVRHIAAGIRQASFAPLVQKQLDAVPHATPTKAKLTNQEKPSI